jgi:polyisoprenoid-binding protein YceI
MATVSGTPSTIPHKKSIWSLDPVHSRIEFSIKHLMISKVKGCFNKYDVQIEWDEDDLTMSSVTAHIDASSISTGDAYRDQHLTSPDFLHVENHPEVTFKSTRIERVSDDEYHIYGDLTIHGVTKEVKLDTTYGGRGVNPASGHTVAGFEALTTINRKDFGVIWNMALDTGGLALGDNVKVEITAELVKQDEAGASA